MSFSAICIALSSQTGEAVFVPRLRALPILPYAKLVTKPSATASTDTWYSLWLEPD
jgi:hypothetical protein